MGKDFIFSLKADLTEVPYLKPFSNLQWRVSKKDISPKVIEAIRMIWDEVSIRQIKGNKLKNELVFKRKQLDNSGNQINQELIVRASPIVGGKNKRENRKLFAEQMDQYKNTLAKIEEEKARLLKEADMLNSFTISSRNFCRNSDCLQFLFNFLFASSFLPFPDFLINSLPEDCTIL